MCFANRTSHLSEWMLMDVLGKSSAAQVSANRGGCHGEKILATSVQFVVGAGPSGSACGRSVDFCLPGSPNEPKMQQNQLRGFVRCWPLHSMSHSSSQGFGAQRVVRIEAFPFLAVCLICSMSSAFLGVRLREGLIGICVYIYIYIHIYPYLF